MPNTCSTCFHFLAARVNLDSGEPDGATQCTYFPQWQRVAPDHYCGQHRSALVAENGMEKKFSDTQLIKRIRENYGKSITWGEGLDVIASDLGVSRRAVEERCKRFERLQIFEVNRGPHGRRISLDVHPAVDNWEWWMEHCAKTGESSKLRWKEAVDRAEMTWPGREEELLPARRNRPTQAKWTVEGHLVPALVASCPTEASACRYSTIAKLVESTHGLPRAAFDRLLRNAVEDGIAVKTPDGLYYLKSP